MIMHLHVGVILDAKRWAYALVCVCVFYSLLFFELFVHVHSKGHNSRIHASAYCILQPKTWYSVTSHSWLRVGLLYKQLFVVWVVYIWLIFIQHHRMVKIYYIGHKCGYLAYVKGDSCLDGQMIDQLIGQCFCYFPKCINKSLWIN